MIYEKRKIFVIFLIIIYLLSSSINRYIMTKKYFLEAKILAKKLNKKLIIIGCPNNNTILMNFLELMFGKMYDHGDITIDLYGCKKCKKIDINDVNQFKKFKNKSVVIFETGVLGFTNDIDKIYQNLVRISDYIYIMGTTDNLFWRFFGNKIYSKFYNYGKINYIVYPNFNKIQYYKI